jgi:hypothetical protein
MEELPPWLAKCYTMVDFSGLRVFPMIIYMGSEDSPIFYGYGDSVVKHISAFIIYCKKNDFLHEDVMMKYFIRESAQMWYESLGKGMFTSFAEFLEVLCASWDSDSKSWLPLIQEIEKLYVAQNF